MTPKQQLLDIYRRYVVQHCDDKYLEDNQKNLQNVLKMDTLPNDSHKKSKIDAFVLKVMNEVQIRCYSAHRSTAIDKIVKEMEKLIDDMFNEDEVNSILIIIKSPIGAKLLRNIDLFRDVFSLGNNILIAKLMDAYATPEVLGKITAYLEELTKEDDTDVAE